MEPALLASPTRLVPGCAQQMRWGLAGAPKLGPKPPARRQIWPPAHQLGGSSSGKGRAAARAPGPSPTAVQAGAQPGRRAGKQLWGELLHVLGKRVGRERAGTDGAARRTSAPAIWRGGMCPLLAGLMAASCLPNWWAHPRPLLGCLRAGGSKHVHSVTAEQAESMYMALCERTNDQHALLVIYTPNCQQCKQMESEVRRAAQRVHGSPARSSASAAATARTRLCSPRGTLQPSTAAAAPRRRTAPAC